MKRKCVRNNERRNVASNKKIRDEKWPDEKCIDKYLRTKDADEKIKDANPPDEKQSWNRMEVAVVCFVVFACCCPRPYKPLVVVGVLCR